MNDAERYNLRETVNFVIHETRRQIGLCIFITACLDLVTLALVYWMVVP